MGVLTMRQFTVIQDFGSWLKERHYKQKSNEIISKDMEKQSDGKDIYKHLGEVISAEVVAAIYSYTLPIYTSKMTQLKFIQSRFFISKPTW